MKQANIKAPGLAMAAVLAVLAVGIGRAHAFPVPTMGSSGLGQTSSHAVQIDNRLYRHCHFVGSRARVVCMTADPWSPEHMELDRRAGRLNHEGGPRNPQRVQPKRRRGTAC